MTNISFKQQTFECTEGQSVLDCLLSHDQAIPHTCKTGACQTCLMKCLSGNPPEKSQQGLKPSLKAQNYFLSCQCLPNDDLTIDFAHGASNKFTTKVLHHEIVSDDILLLKIEKPDDYKYIPGQYLTLWKNEVEGRPYSIASVPELTPNSIELHIQRCENGEVSSWVCDEIKTGDQIQIQDPIGHCCYTRDETSASILLAGSGTGLAPLIGIAKDALTQNHTGQIHLFHSARKLTGLYKHDELMELSASHENFYYHPIISSADKQPADEHIHHGDLTDSVMDFIKEPAHWRFYLCGAEKRVTQLRKKLFLSGAAMKNIYSDAFVQKTN